jgi:hypothetical protein
LFSAHQASAAATAPLLRNAIPGEKPGWRGIFAEGVRLVSKPQGLGRKPSPHVDFLLGTFLPFARASESPIGIACF